MNAHHVRLLLQPCPQTFDKRKATDKLAFPLRFDLQHTLAHASMATGVDEAAALAAAAACVGPDGSPAGEYELVAVMIHKGSSASHGHYGKCQGYQLCRFSSCCNLPVEALYA